MTTSERSKLTSNLSAWKKASNSSKAQPAPRNAKPPPTTKPRPFAALETPAKTEVFQTTTATPALCCVRAPNLISRPQTNEATACPLRVQFLPDTAPAPLGPNPTVDNNTVCTRSTCVLGAYRCRCLSISLRCQSRGLGRFMAVLVVVVARCLLPQILERFRTETRIMLCSATRRKLNSD
jgi:hypothetical protein